MVKTLYAAELLGRPHGAGFRTRSGFLEKLNPEMSET